MTNFIKMMWLLLGVGAGMVIMHVMSNSTAKSSTSPPSLRTDSNTLMMPPSTIATGPPPDTTTTASGGVISGGGGYSPVGDTAATSSTTTSSSPYSKFQPIGFQLYTGGAPAFIKTTTSQDDSNSTTSSHHHKHDKVTGETTTKVVPNPECDRKDSFGHNMEESTIECYMGLEDTKVDIQQRLDIMINAVERAYEYADQDPTTLKIFIAPEFFWRGVDGAYIYDNNDDSDSNDDGEEPKYDDDDDCREICTILQNLEGFVAQKRFEDWLFVFGTVVVSELLPVEDKYDYLFYNFAPIYKGYDPYVTNYNGKRFIVPKRYVSNIDFLTPRRHFDDTIAKELIQLGGYFADDQKPSAKTVEHPWDLARSQYDREMWHKYKEELDALGYTMIEYDWLIIDGITFTLEVCLDHDVKTALNSYLADAVTGSTTRIPSVNTKGAAANGDNCNVEYVPIPRHMAQISIVSSSGMTVNADSMALASGGTIILQDGLSDRDSNMTWAVDEGDDDQCQQYTWHFIGGSEVVQRFGVVSPTEAIFNYKVNTNYTTYPIYQDDDDNKNWKDALAGVFTTQKYPPELTVYTTNNIVQV